MNCPYCKHKAKLLPYNQTLEKYWICFRCPNTPYFDTENKELVKVTYYIRGEENDFYVIYYRPKKNCVEVRHNKPLDSKKADSNIISKLLCKLNIEITPHTVLDLITKLPSLKAFL